MVSIIDALKQKAARGRGARRWFHEGEEWRALKWPRLRAARCLLQYAAITLLLFVFVFVLFPADETLTTSVSAQPLTLSPTLLTDGVTAASAPEPLSDAMKTAMVYVARRYRVSREALLPLFELTQAVSKERNVDPLLVISVICIESRFNPFAESSMGAQGLMQVMPKFHMDKLPMGSGGTPSFLDPETNVRVGVRILDESIRRRGGLVAGLQYYAGSSDPGTGYANRVLAEKQRIEQAIKLSQEAGSARTDSAAGGEPVGESGEATGESAGNDAASPAPAGGTGGVPEAPT